MTEQLSPEAAEELLRFGKPLMYGAVTVVASEFVMEKTTSLSDDYRAQQDIGSKISNLQTEISTIESADELLKDNLTNSEEVHSRQAQISELQEQKDEHGNQTINFGIGYGPSLALGLVAVSVGLKRAWSKSIVNKNRNE